MSVDLVLGNEAQATPLPVDLKYCPLTPVVEPTLIAPPKVEIPVTFKVVVVVPPDTNTPSSVVSNRFVPSKFHSTPSVAIACKLVF